MIVQHNITSMNANRQLGIVGNNLAKSTEKLSSGYRVNRAADDAAGLAISEKMRAQVRGLNRASDNAQDGISLIQTAEGAMDQKHAILQRTRELLVQASNSGVLDASQENDFQKIQDEINTLQDEYNRIDTDTEFNKKKLLNGSYEEQWLQVGANSGQGIKVTIASTEWDPELYMSKAAEEGAADQISSEDQNGIIDGVEYNKDIFTVSKSIKLDTGVTLYANEDGDYAVTIDSVEITDSDFKTKLEDKTDESTIELAGKLAVALGYKDAAAGVAGITAALTAAKKNEEYAVSKADGEAISGLLDKVDVMIKNVTTERSKLGAIQNRLEYTVKVDDNTAENMQSAESRIRDTDMADEMTRFSKESILQQAATSMLAQANQANQGVLSLLQ